MGVRQPTSARLVATLAAAGLVSGLVLVGVYQLTRPHILRNQAEAIEAAIYEVLPGTARAATFEARDGELRPWDGPPVAPAGVELIYTGRRDDGSLVGYAILGEGSGFQDTIRLIFGFDPQRRVITGMVVLESRETPGLGDKIIVDDDFHHNFEALAVKPAIVLVKKGAKTRDHEVDGITGATISSEAVVAILNRSSAYWLPRIEAAADLNKNRALRPDPAGGAEEGGRP